MEHNSIPTLFAVLVLVLASGQNLKVWAQEATGLSQIRVVKDIGDVFDDLVFENNEDVELNGLPFPPGANTLLVLDESGAGGAEVVMVDKMGSQISRVVSDPINVTVDAQATGAKGNGTVVFLVLNPATKELSAARAGPQGFLNLNTIQSVDMTVLGLENPQGMTLDPNSNHLFVLDVPAGAGPRIVRTDLGPGRNINSINARADVEKIELRGLGRLRGIAFNPANGHLFVMSPDTQQLHEVTDRGELVATFDFPGDDKINPQGLAFAASLDQTDDPLRVHLFIASRTEITEWSLTARPDRIEASLRAPNLENGR